MTLNAMGFAVADAEERNIPGLTADSERFMWVWAEEVLSELGLDARIERMQWREYRKAA